MYCGAWGDWIADRLIDFMGWLRDIVPEWDMEVPAWVDSAVLSWMKADGWLPLSEAVGVVKWLGLALAVFIAFRWGMYVVNLVRGAGA